VSEASNGYIATGTDGQVWDMAPGRPAIFKLLCDQTNGSIAIFEEVLPPGSGTPLHIHHTSDEVIHIHSGNFVVRLGDEKRPAGEGDWIFIPRGLRHAWRNTGTAVGRAFFIFTPGAGAKTVEEMRFLGKFALDITPEERDEIWKRHGTEFITRDW
jgi:quercetin dioxygenase-like cupin family protein